MTSRPERTGRKMSKDARVDARAEKRKTEALPTVLTIGHSTRTLEEFIRLDQAHAVTRVVMGKAVLVVTVGEQHLPRDSAGADRVHSIAFAGEGNSGCLALISRSPVAGGAGLDRCRG